MATVPRKLRNNKFQCIYVLQSTVTIPVDHRGMIQSFLYAVGRRSSNNTEGPAVVKSSAFSIGILTQYPSLVLISMIMIDLQFVTVEGRKWEGVTSMSFQNASHWPWLNRS